jgi:tagatose 1,6-diphosphate aldolase GatY/KbaY
MKAKLSEILSERSAARAAVGAFTCYDLTTAIGVLTAAERASVPVIILVSQASAAASTGRLLLAGLGALAQASKIPVCVQLDHATDIGVIERSLDTSTVDAVLADGSRLPDDENLGFALRVSELARRHDAEIEVELGHVEGREDIAETARAGTLTDPATAVRFIELSEAACLAVSIGNVHGTYAEPPRLDWNRLDEIRSLVRTPLALHGASGLPDDHIRRAIAGGIAKVNVNTEIRERTIEAIAANLESVSRGARVIALNNAVVAAVADVVAAKIALFGSAQYRKRVPERE